MNLVFTAFFAFEFVVKFAAFGLREYVKDPWNNFDFIIVIGSFLDIIMAQVSLPLKINYFYGAGLQIGAGGASISMLRLFRAMRLVGFNFDSVFFQSFGEKTSLS